MVVMSIANAGKLSFHRLLSISIKKLSAKSLEADLAGLRSILPGDGRDGERRMPLRSTPNMLSAVWTDNRG